MRISVIMPSFNQGSFLENSIQSVLSQNHPDLEFILMDGGSTDNSVAIIEKYSDQISYWQSESDGGQSAAINAGMSRATGEICCWLNSDDLFADGALNKVEKYFADHECQWLVGGGERHSPSGKLLGRVPPRDISLDGLVDWDNNHINQPSVFWRKALWDQVGGLNPALNCVMDFELWLKFGKISEAHAIDDTLAVTVMHKAMKTQSIAAEMLVEHCLVLHDLGYQSEAREKLTQAVQWAFSVDRKLQFLNKIPFYKAWRGRANKKKQRGAA